MSDKESAALYPLEGVRVADFSHLLAGPFCTRMLCDLGADVIKFESPKGDVARKLGSRRGGMNGYFMQQNCGKRNVSIDLGYAEGCSLVTGLFGHFDVLVENFRPGAMSDLGLGADVARVENPALIYCSISGFGHDSPLAGQLAFAGVAHATTGMLHRQAFVSGQDPIDSALAVGDTVTGLQATIAILAALRLRERTGRGQFIEMAMHDGILAIQEAANSHLFGGDGRETDFFCSWTYRCGDEHLVVPDDPRANWEKFAKLMDRPELLGDERYDSHSKREARLDELEALIAGWVADQTSATAVVEMLHAAGMPGARIMSMGEALESEQTRARGMTVKRDDRSGGTVPVLNSPYRFSDATAGVRGRPAFRGEHNFEIMSELLGMDREEFERLEAAGVLSSRIPPGYDGGKAHREP